LVNSEKAKFCSVAPAKARNCTLTEALAQQGKVRIRASFLDAAGQRGCVDLSAEDAAEKQTQTRQVDKFECKTRLQREREDVAAGLPLLTSFRP
jgi:hypothetical protein